ncbi:MAG TPA: M48 family metalloprotease, partial [Candidatus Acidoferrales bacterium]|nr:M48 family metalloprotease [Candidatus Acidoferrales bacterium]
PIHAWKRSIAALICAALIAIPLCGLDLGAAQDKPADGRTQVKPGIDRYSVDQDVQLGRAVSRQVERQMPMLNDRRVDDYLNDLGQRLAAVAPGPKFHYEFHCLNSREINAFALPGGFVFVYRGAIETAVNEAQLAGIIAHEISHAALRHGTNQATKAEIWGAVGAIGGVVAGGSAAGIASQIGGNLAINATLLKYSRTAETQADVVGTQILHDAGYDNRALGQFFEQLDSDQKGKKPVEFFADHPNYEHRLDRINEEVDKMGGPPENYVRDSQAFRDVRRYLLSLPPPPPKKKNPPIAGDPAIAGRPPLPSQDTRRYEGIEFRAEYPANWEVRTPRSNSSGAADPGAAGDSSAAADAKSGEISFMPPNAIITDSKGAENVAYGILVDRQDVDSGSSLDDATNVLVATLRKENPGMRASGSPVRIRVDGEAALSVTLEGDSPRGGSERDLLITILRNDPSDSPNSQSWAHLLYFICVAPAAEFDDYNPTFQQFIASIRFTR